MRATTGSVVVALLAHVLADDSTNPRLALVVGTSAVLSVDVVPHVFRNLCTLFASVQSASHSTSDAMTAKQPFDFELSSSSNDIEAATTAAMGSALRRAAAAKTDVPISADEANVIMASALQARSVETRMNAVGMLGVVGQRSQNPVEIEVIARCLGSSLQDASLEVVAEALNAIFDVFCDEDFDAVFQTANLLAALEQTATAVRAKLRAERKELDRALVAHVKETHLNLVRFLKYKKKHLGV